MMATPADATADQLLGYGLWFMVCGLDNLFN